MWNYLHWLDIVGMGGFAVPAPSACERDRFAVLRAARRKARAR